MKRISRIAVALIAASVSILVRGQVPNVSAPPPNVNAALSAEYEQAKGTFRDFATESAVEFVKIKAYHEQLLTEGRITHQFRTANGELIHCIEIGSQRSIKNPGVTPKDIKLAPEGLPAESGSTRPAVANPPNFGLDGTLDPEGNVRTCPSGSIPIVIRSLEDLCRFKRLEDLFKKYPENGGQNTSLTPGRETNNRLPPLPPEPLGSGVPHEYAHAYSIIDNQGEQADFNVWQPTVEQTSEFSLSQLWVGRGSGANHQTVETGWQVCFQLYGNSQPHLFIYTTTNNYAGAPGGYNLDSFFVQTNPNVVIGGSLSPVSTVNGTQYHITLMFYRDSGGSHDWWLKFGDTWVGYYPNNRYNSAGIADKSSEIDFGGEIINLNTGGVHTTTDMGSGHFASEGWQHSAFTKHITYVDMTSTIRNASNLTPSITNPSYYDLSLFSTSDPNWVNYFYFGGPGRVSGSTSGPKPDFNGDGKADILWQNNSTGQHTIWLMNGTTYMSSADLISTSLAWQIATTGDFNNDSKVDVYWQNTQTGQIAVQLMNGTTTIGWVDFTFPTAWRIVGTGDFNGDSKTDILWQNIQNGQVTVWLLNGTTTVGWVDLFFNVALSWTIVGTGDFNGDGKVDILWLNTQTGQVSIELMNGTGTTGWANPITVPLAWRIAGASDLNGDGKVDILWQNTQTAQRTIELMNGTTTMGWADLFQGQPEWEMRNH
jgi:hypothetical protein